ncbi:chemotaxis protein CheW [Dokdonella soli]|uniref:CheW-like domain-containing protein n=1 Tax=Dokdonella soli TaxID=529810 RepID=A0ABN1ISZ8_9GAMM
MPTFAPSSLEPVRSQRASIALRVHPSLPLLVLDAGVIAQQLTDATIAPVPMCAPWFRGVARHGGQIVPFFDLALWVEVERRRERATTMISIASGPCFLGLLASEPPMILPAGRSIVPWAGKADWIARGANPDVACAFDPPTWLAEIAPTLLMKAARP